MTFLRRRLLALGDLDMLHDVGMTRLRCLTQHATDLDAAELLQRHHVPLGCKQFTRVCAAC